MMHYPRGVLSELSPAFPRDSQEFREKGTYLLMLLVVRMKHFIS